MVDVPILTELLWREVARPSQVRIGPDEASDADRWAGRIARHRLGRAARADERRWQPRDEGVGEQSRRLARRDLARVDVAPDQRASALGGRTCGGVPSA